MRYEFKDPFTKDLTVIRKRIGRRQSSCVPAGREAAIRGSKGGDYRQELHRMGRLYEKVTGRRFYDEQTEAIKSLK